MRLVMLALALFVFPFTAAAAVPNMTCKTKGAVMGLEAGPTLHRIDDASDVFRIANGKLYHGWSGREEYFYNDIKGVDLGCYVSGQMVFVLDYDNRSGYVVTAGPGAWTVNYLDCTS